MGRMGSSLPSLVNERSPSAAGVSSRAQRPAPNQAARKQKFMAIAAVVILVAAGGLLYWQLFTGPPSAAAETRRRDLIDSKSGKLFEAFTIPPNSRFPYTNPDTGEATLYPAEKCFWTPDGKAKTKPDFVLLNQYAGKEGDTLCPVCKRKVVAHNPMPPPAIMKEAAPGE